MEYCRNSCGFSSHRCKWEEHNENTCPEAIVPCINAENGCKELMNRRNLGTHLQCCPASVVRCRAVHSRKVNSKSAEKQPNNLIDEKLLEGDMFLIDEHQGIPSQGLQLPVTNSSYTITSRNKYGVTLSSRGRFSHVHEQKSECEFFCNEIIRRSEFDSHWRFHLDVQCGVIVERCPLKGYGCSFGRDNLLPSPAGTIMDYSKEEDCLLVALPSLVPSNSDPECTQASQYEAKIQEKKELSIYGYGDDEDESYDVLGQLPFEILLYIINYLDSISLWNMSLVNLFFRKACFSVVKKQGIVYFKWTKESRHKWICSPEVCMYTRIGLHTYSGTSLKVDPLKRTTSDLKFLLPIVIVPQWTYPPPTCPL